MFCLLSAYIHIWCMSRHSITSHAKVWQAVEGMSVTRLEIKLKVATLSNLVFWCELWFSWVEILRHYFSALHEVDVQTT